MRIVFLLEERSTKELLDVLLPRILPPEVSFLTIPHEGKSDLQKSISIKLKAWKESDVYFVIIQDQDSNDCHLLKAKIKELCNDCGRKVLIRIACHEMEAWYFGDLEAVSKAYGKNLKKYAEKKKYRNPDAIVSPKQELRKLLPEHEQIVGARKIAPYMNPDKNTSKSFNALIEGLKRITISALQ